MYRPASLGPIQCHDLRYRGHRVRLRQGRRPDLHRGARRRRAGRQSDRLQGQRGSRQRPQGGVPARAGLRPRNRQLPPPRPHLQPPELGRPAGRIRHRQPGLPVCPRLCHSRCVPGHGRIGCLRAPFDAVLRRRLHDRPGQRRPLGQCSALCAAGDGGARGPVHLCLPRQPERRRQRSATRRRRPLGRRPDLFGRTGQGRTGLSQRRTRQRRGRHQGIVRRWQLRPWRGQDRGQLVEEERRRFDLCRQYAGLRRRRRAGRRVGIGTPGACPAQPRG